MYPARAVLQLPTGWHALGVASAYMPDTQCPVQLLQQCSCHQLQAPVKRISQQSVHVTLAAMAAAAAMAATVRGAGAADNQSVGYHEADMGALHASTSANTAAQAANAVYD